MDWHQEVLDALHSESKSRGRTNWLYLPDRIYNQYVNTYGDEWLSELSNYDIDTFLLLVLAAEEVVL